MLLITISTSILYIKAADRWFLQQNSANQLTSYCLTFTVSRHSSTMASCITHLEVSIDETDEKMLQSKGFKRIYPDLNKGTGSKPIYLWYKAELDSKPITRVQITFNDEMAIGLINAGYSKIPKNLKAGKCGGPLYLWYYRGNTEYDVPIVEIDVTQNAENEANKFSFGWERLSCDVNRGARGDYIHIWVKRGKETYICDVAASDSFGTDVDYLTKGYVRVDEDTNRGARGAYVFIWFRMTTDRSLALSDLEISTNRREYQALQQQSYLQVKVDLNEGTGGEQVYLWYKRDQANDPIKCITLLLNSGAFKVYEEAGIKVITKNLNQGNQGNIEYLAVYQ